MAEDGHIDYGRYTKTQLREALSSIDQSRFPLNFNALQRELANRNEEASVTTQNSEVSMPPQKPKSRWPVLVRIILVVYLLGFVVGALVTVALVAGTNKVPTPLARYIAALDFWDYAVAGIGLVLAVALVVNLYRMRRSALYIAIAICVNDLVGLVPSYENLRLLGYGPLQMIPGSIISGLVAYYLWRLHKKGLLA